MKLSRRRFVQGMLALPAVPIAWPRPGLSFQPLEQTARTTVRSGRWTQSGGDYLLGQRTQLQLAQPAQGLLKLAPQALSGSYVSPPYRAAFAFNALALAWSAEIPTGASLQMAVRVSSDGLSWSAWLPVEEDADLKVRTETRFSRLVSAGGQLLQWQAQFVGDPGATPALGQVVAIYIDSLGNSSIPPSAPAGPGAAAGAVPAPAIISRASWGCPEPYSSPDWSPEYTPWQKTVVHHTATTNSYSDGAYWVRAVWQYHAIDRGWGDIGYNFLVDRFGNIYQGRFGGDNVIAGHALCYNTGSAGVSLIGSYDVASVPAAAQRALVDLLAWISYGHSIHPLGSSYFVDRTLANICAHKDCNNNNSLYSGRSCLMSTTCPGTYLYSQIYSVVPSLRQRAWETFPTYGAVWGNHNTPTQMVAGATAEVDITVTNVGSLTWGNAGTNPVHLGYHWFRTDGTPYSQDPGDDHRTATSGDVAFGQTASVHALVTAPRDGGNYTLKWDLVQEDITWFESQGLSTLDADITVLGTVLAITPQRLTFLADQSAPPAPQGLTVRNAGNGPLHWSASCDQEWCRPSAVSGDAPSTIAVSIEVDGLQPGQHYSATLTISCAGASYSPQQAAVTFVYMTEPVKRGYLPAVHS